MSVLDLVRPDLRELVAYETAQQVAGAVRLNANESPYRPVTDSCFRPLNRYPEARPVQLTEALAGHYSCEAENLLVTRGSSEAIDLVMRVFGRAGIDNVILSPPTFSMYEHYAAVQGIRVTRVPLAESDDFRFDTKRIIDACDDLSRLILVCRPNNPTGDAPSLDDIRTLAEARRDRSVIVVDEAYIEFSAMPSAAGLLDEFDNIVVLRTLSKAHGLAGLRCGAMISTRPVVRQLSAVQAPYSIATPIVESVQQELSRRDSRQSELNIRAIVEERTRLAARLRRLPQVERVFPSHANFLLVRFTDAATVADQCRSAGILIRELGPELEGCARITVGTPDENKRLLDVLESSGEACA